MTNTLIIVAHPEATSFNHALATCAKDHLTGRGHSVTLTDLYDEGFDASERGALYPVRVNRERFDVQSEQRFNSANGTLPHDVRKHIADIKQADLVIVQFPLWWFTMPAILKGWIDRTFAYGELYSSQRRFDRGLCKGKQVMLSVTLGSSIEDCAPGGREGNTRLLLWPLSYTFHYLGFTVLDPHLIYGVRPYSPAEIQAGLNSDLSNALSDFRKELDGIEDRKAMQFNGAADWGADGRLLPTAPVLSPFIGHGR